MALDAASSQGGNPVPSRKGLYFPFIALLLVMIGWTVFWFVTAGKADKVVDGFIAREASRGRDWVCPNRSVSGYPFRIQLNCDNPQLLEKNADGVHREATLGGLSLHARILSPGHFIAVLAPPFRTRQGSDGEMDLSWQSARASFRASQEGFADASVELSAPVAAIGVGENKDIRALAKDVAFHLRRSPGDVPGTDVVLRVGDLTFAPLDQLTGNPEPLKLEFQASAPGLLLEPTQRIETTLDAWVAGGGKARVLVAKATKGNASLDVSGTLGLDDKHRLHGNLQGRTKGLEALTGRFTRATGLDIGGLLGKLGGNQGLPISLSFDAGKMRFGPFLITEIPPLY